ncbi:MAG: right-handed parallel beta-helix repeat-containing protein [Armatimonadetes bacterium]|nr:right-handed parallel beta-helix repeat-containing protein [Armatimonadota bacterium]
MCLWCLLTTVAHAREVQVAPGDPAALPAALAAAQPGDTVRLAAGTYTIAAALHLKPGVKLLGAGADQTVVLHGGEQPGSFVDISGCEDGEVGGIGFDAQGNVKVTQGISGGNARRLLLHDLAIRNLGAAQTWGPHGILFSGNNPTKTGGVTDSVIRDCTIENIAAETAWGAGIRLAWGSSRNRVEHCTIRNTGRGGILTDDGSTELVIRGNTITGSGGEGLGIEIWGGCDRSVIEDNQIDHWLSVGGCDDCAVRRNVISDHSGVVKFIGIEAIGSRLVITGNTVDDGQQIGLSVSGTTGKDDVYYADNVFRQCIQWGAQLQGETNGIHRSYFYRCKFNDNVSGRAKMIYPQDGAHGLRTNGNCQGMVFEECEFDGNSRWGLQLGGGQIDQLDFRRCRIRNNQGAAVVGPGDATAHEWTDCTVEGNARNELPAAKPFAHAAPTAAWDGPVEAAAGRAVDFRSTAAAAAGKLVSWLWDFGDGPPESRAEVGHTFAQPGDYVVTLVVWDDSGRGARASRTLRVR